MVLDPLCSFDSLEKLSKTTGDWVPSFRETDLIGLRWDADMCASKNTLEILIGIQIFKLRLENTKTPRGSGLRRIHV